MNKQLLETAPELQLQYDPTTGLLPAIVQDAETRDILMLAYINPEAFHETVRSGVATFWSRSRGELWKKGETSGNRMLIEDILVDCDQDTVIYLVRPEAGGACHTKNQKGEYRNSCFYRRVTGKNTKLEYIEK